MAAIKKLKAAALLESIIAMVVIVISIGVGTMTFVNVLNNDRGILKVKTSLLLNRVADDEKKKAVFLDGEEKNDELTVKKYYKHYDGTGNVIEMSLEAVDAENNFIMTRKELLIVP